LIILKDVRSAALIELNPAGCAGSGSAGRK